ncbi:exported hypothetical protein [Candidatus Zixiibacteriota bacterium]|nr:exported hypothetical protein [candidate division Zixibacteria bacterium]
MKKLTLLTVVLLAFSVSSFAETMWRPVLYLGGGASVPTGNFKDGFKTGYNFASSFGFEYHSSLELLGELSYSRFPLDQTKSLATEPLGTSVDGGAARVLNIGGAVRYYFTPGSALSKFRPYILGRLGVAHLSQADMTIVGLDGTTINSFSGSTKFTYAIGAGTNIDLNRNLGLWVEGKFDGISTPLHKTDYVPIQAGIRYIFGKE